MLRVSMILLLCRFEDTIQTHLPLESDIDKGAFVMAKAFEHGNFYQVSLVWPCSSLDVDKTGSLRRLPVTKDLTP